MIYLLPAAVAFSAAMIVLLWRGDPKRRRVAGLPGGGEGVATRRLLAVAALLPGVFLAIVGDSAAFLVWLGSCAVGGWFVTQSGVRDRSG